MSTFTVTIPSHELKRLIAETAYAAAKDDSRPVLAGVSVHVEQNRVQFAATDGFRLAIADTPLDEERDIEDTIQCIVPARTLVDLGKQIGKRVEQIEVSVIGRQHYVDAGAELVYDQITFSGAHIVLTSRLIEGTFPAVEQLVPKSFKTVAILDREVFAAAVKRGNVINRENNDVCKFDLISEVAHAEEKRVTISSNAAEVGDVISDLYCHVEGPSGVIAFNGGFVLDVANNYSGDQLAMEMNGPKNAGVFRSVGSTSVSVVMPMHLAQ